MGTVYGTYVVLCTMYHTGNFILKKLHIPHVNNVPVLIGTIFAYSSAKSTSFATYHIFPLLHNLVRYIADSRTE
jgi:hypothetical protein